MPAEEFAWAPLPVQLLVAGALVGFGLWRFGRGDIPGHRPHRQLTRC